MFETCQGCGGHFSEVEMDGFCTRCSNQRKKTEDVLDTFLDGKFKAINSTSVQVANLEHSLVELVLLLREVQKRGTLPTPVNGEKCPHCGKTDHEYEMRSKHPCALNALLGYL